VFSDELEDAFNQLKEAEAKSDAALVKKLASTACALARAAVSAPAPESEFEKDAWAKRATWARDVELYAEYSLYATALKSPAPITVDLLGTLEQQNPSSKYLDAAYSAYFIALVKSGSGQTIPLVAERALKHFPENEDALLVLADTAMNRRETDRALTYAERLVNVMAKHSKPEAMSAADWERKRTAVTAKSRWIAGLMHSQKGQHYEADRDLRVALPLVRGDSTMLASTLFYLGVANYQLGAATRDRARIMEAAGFSEEAAKIKGPLSHQAWQNAQAMRTEAQKLR
jgi:hypothetical protein